MQLDAASPANKPAEPLTLVAEISHRVVNEYSQAIAGIRLAAAEIRSPEAREALTSAAARLRRYAEAHRALQAPSPGANIDLANYLQRLCEALSTATLAELRVRLLLAADAIELPTAQCWRVALIVSELITNALRHGLRNGPGQIVVQVAANDGWITCKVSDDGNAPSCGHPARGSAVVQALAADLAGAVSWRLEEGGVTAELRFPTTRPWSAQ